MTPLLDHFLAEIIMTSYCVTSTIETSANQIVAALRKRLFVCRVMAVREGMH